MRNTSREEKAEVKNFFLSEFSLRLQASGYPARFRYQVIEAGIRTFEKQVERDTLGICPLYRPRSYNEEERKKDVRYIWTILPWCRYFLLKRCRRCGSW